MPNLTKRLKAHAAYLLMKHEAEEELEPRIMRNKRHRTPDSVNRILNIVFLKNNKMEIKGDR